MNSFPWFELAAAASLCVFSLVLYEIYCVRSLRRKLAKITDHCWRLEKALRGANGVLTRQAAEEQEIRNSLAGLGQRLGQLELRNSGRSFEQAIDLAGQGEGADRLVSCFGLTEMEAKLVSLLHGDRRGRQSRPDRTAAS